MSEAKPKRERKPLKIECKKTKCDENLHCFLDPPKRKKDRESLSSPTPEEASNHKQQEVSLPHSARNSSSERCCWNCGANLVDWNRVHTQNLDEVDYIFSCLKQEYVRHDFWCKDIDIWAINNARRRGRLRMPEYAEKRIRQSAGKAQPYNDGFQTPPEGDILYYAQHATATCCRKCMEAWYGIPQGRPLTDDEIVFCSGLLLHYIDQRMPSLGDEPEYVPPIRMQRSEDAQYQQA